MQKEKEKIDWKIICTGLVCLTAAEIYALHLGYNGTLLKLFICVIAVAIGVLIPNPLKGGYKK